MSLSAKRREAIYDAVADCVTAARIALKCGPGDEDDVMFRLSIHGPQAAVEAAEGRYDEAFARAKKVRGDG